MSLLDRWVANTKRVLAKDKNTGSEYEFESIFPDGAPDGTAFSAENMNKIIDAVNGLDESKGQPNGIATLNSSGKLVQMPTAADVAALPASAISSGSNDNGSWIKLPGGIMICWGTRNGTTGDNGSIPGSTAFPAAFAEAPSYVGCLADWSHHSVEYVDLTASNVRFVFRTYSGGYLTDSVVEFKFMAIGSW